MKHLRFITIVFSVFMITVASGAVHAGQEVKKITSEMTTIKPLELNLPCDVSVSYIEYFNCPCDIKMDVYYADRTLSVKLFNDSTLKPTVALTVKYYDIFAHKLRTITKDVTFTGRGGKHVIMNNRPMLIKKSYGVTAEVVLKSKNMRDPNMANNKKTQKICGAVPE
jgi:hypothetical protein